MNKKILVYSLVVLLLLNVLGVGTIAAKVTDVPVDHWAYHSVNTAVSKEYLSLFEDGTFQGTRSVDRYTLANVVARLLEDIEVSRLKGTSGDLSLIRELSIEFEKDLATWYADQQALQDEVEHINQKAITAEERLSRVVSAQVGLEEHVAELSEEIEILQLSINKMYAGEGENEVRLGELLAAVVQLEKDVREQGESIKSLENWAGEKGAAFATLQATDAALTAEVETLTKRNQELEADLQEVAIRLRRETQTLGELTDELRDLKTDKSAIAEIKQQLDTDVYAEMNAALIREQRLERQIKSIEEEFQTYRATAQKDVKSAKTLATVGIALGAIAAVIAAINLK